MLVKTCVEGGCWEGKRQVMAPAISWEMLSGALLWKESNSLHRFSRRAFQGASDWLASPSPEHGDSGAQNGARAPRRPVAAAEVGWPSAHPLCPDVLTTSCDPAADDELESKSGHLHHVGVTGQREGECVCGVEALSKGLQRPSGAWMGLLAASLP